MIIRHVAPRRCRQLLFSHVIHHRQCFRPYSSNTTPPRTEAELAVYRAIEAQLGTQTTADPQTIPDQDANLDQPQFEDPAALAAQKREEANAIKLDDYFTWQHLRSNQHRLGAVVESHYEPKHLINDPPRPSDVTLELLMASQTHLGHSTSLWNPANSRYIFGVRQGIHIISLDVTAAHLRRAARVVSGVAEKGGLVLFVGTRPGYARPLVRAAELGRPAYHHFTKWKPGTITNGQQLLDGCAMQVVDEQDRPVEGFGEQLYNRPVMKPDLVVCLNPLENYVLLHECSLAGIPTIGVIDTDANPSWVTYPIPANDDSLRSIAVIAGVLGRAAQEGNARRLEAARTGKIVNVTPGLQAPTQQDLPSHLRTTIEDMQNEREAQNARESSEAQALASIESSLKAQKPESHGSRRESESGEAAMEQSSPGR